MQNPVDDGSLMDPTVFFFVFLYLAYFGDHHRVCLLKRLGEETSGEVLELQHHSHRFFYSSHQQLTMLRRSLTLLLGLSATSVLSVDLFQALQSNGFTDFARLAAQVPSITQVPGSGQVIYASTNEAIREANLNRGPSGSRRRDEGDEPRPTPEELECQCTNTHSQKQKRDAIVSPGSARQTLLDDASLVNLGPGRNQTVVEKCLPNLLFPIIYSGLGVNVSVVGNDIPFDGGVIRPVGG